MTFIPPLTVSGPARAPRQNGLLSVVNLSPEGTDPHWQGGGIQWTSPECGPIDGIGSWACDPETVVGLPKDLDSGLLTGEATPFTVYAPFVCTPVGVSVTEAQGHASTRLLANEEARVEQAFWTGDLENTPNLSGANGYDAPTALGTFDRGYLAIAAVEAEIAETYGVGVIHVPVRAASILLAKGGLTRSGGRIVTDLGTPVAVGAGYPDVLEIRGTSGLVGVRSEVFTSSNRAGDLLDRGTNDLHAIAERSYVLGIEPCGVYSATFTVADEEVAP